MAGSDLPCLARPHQSFVSVPNTEPGSVPGYWSSASSGQFLRSSGTGSGVVLSTAAGLTFHIQHQHCTDRGAGSASLFEVLELHFPPIFPQNLHRCIDQFRTNLALNLPTQRGGDLTCLQDRQRAGGGCACGISCSWFAVCLCSPLSANAAQALLLLRHWAFLAWLHRSNNTSCAGNMLCSLGMCQALF